MQWIQRVRPKRSFREWRTRDKWLFMLLILLLLFPIGVRLGIVESPLYVNITPSAPMGIYIKSWSQELTPQAYVLVNENHRLDRFYTHTQTQPPRFLLKHIAGMPNDTMEVTATSVIIRGDIYPTLAYSSKGVPLMHLPEGRYVLQNDEYFVANHPNRSYDSRYFGPVSRNEIQAVVTPLWIFGDEVVEFVNQWNYAEHG